MGYSLLRTARRGLRETRAPLSNPVLDLPGFHLPWRDIFHAPLLKMLRWPVAYPRSFLGDRLLDAHNHAPPDLPGRLADHIDEFGLVGHDGLSSQHANAFSRREVCAQLLNDFLRRSLECRRD